MTHVHHELAEEFPEHAEKLRELKIGSAHFVKLSTDYTAVNHELHLIESGLKPTSDERTESLKKRRLALKDQINSMLVAP